MTIAAVRDPDLQIRGGPVVQTLRWGRGAPSPRAPSLDSPLSYLKNIRNSKHPFISFIYLFFLHSVDNKSVVRVHKVSKKIENGEGHVMMATVMVIVIVMVLTMMVLVMVLVVVMV